MEQAEVITLPSDSIITPEAITAWPLAVGWWLLLIVLIALVVTGVVFFRRYQQKWLYRHAALSELKSAIAQASSTNKSSIITTQLMTIIKRTYISAYPKSTLATLEGSQFLQHINSQVSAPIFSGSTLNTINSSLYSNQDIDVDIFYKECCQWVKHHPTQLNPNVGEGTHV